MDVAPAAAEVAVVMGAVVQGACMQQYAAAAVWVLQRAACVGGAAGGGGRGHNRMDGRQPACVWQRAADVACVQQRAAERHVCDSMQRQRAGGSSQQHDCNGRQ
jgi:hypothetical protein